LVNGQPIYLADYEREVSQYEADLPARGIEPTSPEGQAEIARARAWILDWMITEVLSEQAATAAGITVSDAEVDASMQQITAENGGEEPFQAKLAARNETYEDAWRKQRREMIVTAIQQRISDAVPEVAEQVHARHILVGTQEEAERLLAQLQAGADFATLASAYSQDPNTRDSGGDLGFFPRGLLTAPEVEETAFTLQPGQFSGVVPSLLGYHIVQVVERDPARPVNPDDRRLLQEQALQEWVENLWAQATIQILVEMAP
jgi:parvulin-like peptidyl-prolyl isomerase